VEHFGGAESGLQLNMDIPQGQIDKDTAALVHLGLSCLAFAAEQSASSRTDEVIDRDTLPREQLILMKGVHTV
jgi:hypothetical protein